ncbi:hypothetical protein [Lactiplantibacillus mudanjiangensis]|nr:hypothetical protein [Lactiplantibacillus mudanjiangensis]
MMNSLAINQALIQRQLMVTYTRYQYSEAETVSPMGPLTLLSPEYRRLTQTVNRMQVVQTTGPVVLTNLTERNVAAKLIQLLAVPTLPPVMQPIAPSSAVLQQAYQRGLLVTGRQVNSLTTWAVPHDQLLLADLAAQSVPSVLALGPYDNTNVATIIDDQRQVVLSQLSASALPKGPATYQYTIQTTAGKTLLTGLPLAAVTPALIGLQLGLSPQWLGTLLLGQPLLPAQVLAHSQLIYEQLQATAAQPIKSAADVMALQTATDLPIATTIGQYRYWDQANQRPLTPAISDLLVVPALTTLYHGPQAELQTTANQLSAGILQVAQRRNYRLQRQSRQLMTQGRADRLRFSRGQLQSFQARPQSESPFGQPIETVFQVWSGSDQLGVDLSFRALVHQLLDQID